MVTNSHMFVFEELCEQLRFREYCGLVDRGKGAKDRLVPLPASTLDVLREYWKTHRHEQLLFPKTTQQGKVVPGTQQTMHESTVQGALRRVVVELKFTVSFRQACLNVFFGIASVVVFRIWEDDHGRTKALRHSGTAGTWAGLL